jgi:CheY-like chemotaxis protein
MSAKGPVAAKPQDVFSLTDQGRAQLHGAGTNLSPEELGLLVLVDGRASAEKVARSSGSVPPGRALEILGKLAQLELIAPGGGQPSDAIQVDDFFTLSVPAAPAAAEASADHEAGIATLQDQGYFVRIARRAAVERKLAEGQKLAVLVVEDEPHLGKLLQTYLKLEGFVPRLATGRDQVVAQLRQAPPPDLMLLDVTLPDADGFEILARLRQHPALKAMPVILLTAKATRESVLRGLRGGADGYITKPFEIDVLMKGVKAVLGLDGAPPAPKA